MSEQCTASQPIAAAAAAADAGCGLMTVNLVGVYRAGNLTHCSVLAACFSVFLVISFSCFILDLVFLMLSPSILRCTLFAQFHVIGHCTDINTFTVYFYFQLALMFDCN